MYENFNDSQMKVNIECSTLMITVKVDFDKEHIRAHHTANYARNNGFNITLLYKLDTAQQSPWWDCCLMGNPVATLSSWVQWKLDQVVRRTTVLPWT